MNPLVGSTADAISQVRRRRARRAKERTEDFERERERAITVKPLMETS